MKPYSGDTNTSLVFTFGQQYRKCFSEFIYFYYYQNNQLINSVDNPERFTSTVYVSQVECSSDEFCCNLIPTPTPTVTPTSCLGSYNTIPGVSRTTDLICGDTLIKNGRTTFISIIFYENECTNFDKIPPGCKWSQDFYYYTWDESCNKITTVVTEEYDYNAQNSRILTDGRIQEVISCFGCSRKVVVKEPIPNTLRNNCGIPYKK
jgi:hypothetical protein